MTTTTETALCFFRQRTIELMEDGKIDKWMDDGKWDIRIISFPTYTNDRSSVHRELYVNIPKSKLSRISLSYQDDLNSDPIYYHTENSLLFVEHNRIYQWNVTDKNGKYLGDYIPSNFKNKYKLILHENQHALWVINGKFIGYINMTQLIWKLVSVPSKESKIKLFHVRSSMHIIINDVHFVYNYNTELLRKIDDELPRYNEYAQIKYLRSSGKVIIIGGACSKIYYSSLDTNGKFNEWKTSEIEMPHFNNIDNFDAIIGMNELIWIFYTAQWDQEIYVIDIFNQKIWDFNDKCLAFNYNNFDAFKRRENVEFSLFDLISKPMKKYYDEKRMILCDGYSRKWTKKYKINVLPQYLTKMIAKYYPSFL